MVHEPRIGGLFEGYSGLSMAVEEVFGGSLAWYSEVDKGALKILGHRFPDVPNVGDVTAVDWSQVEPVDILTGGSPCQDLSHAGKRAGMTEGTRSNLWVAMREAIAQLRPRLIIWENVRGAYTAPADSDLEFCAGCMGDPQHGGPALRALGRVLGDLSDLGYDAKWHGLRIPNGCHARFRVFLAATDARRIAGEVPTSGRFPAVEEPAGYGNSAKPPLLPTPSVADATGGHHCRSGDRSDELLLNGVAYHQRWGDYAAAIARWESAIGRPAPVPTQPSAKGNPQLAPAFVEWMQGLPPGWVSDVPGLTRHEALRALGNGVCPQQAVAALRAMFSRDQVAA